MGLCGDAWQGLDQKSAYSHSCLQEPRTMDLPTTLYPSSCRSLHPSWSQEEPMCQGQCPQGVTQELLCSWGPGSLSAKGGQHERPQEWLAQEP